MEESTNNTPPVNAPHHDRAPVPAAGKSKQKLLSILLALAIVAASVFGYLWWHNKDNNSNAQTSTPVTTPVTPTVQPVAEACPSAVEFSNKSMGVSFCYPVAWGDYIVKNDKLAPADTGTRLAVNFSKKSAVHVSGASTNWTTKVGRDGVCSDPVTTAPSFGDFSTTWQTDGSGMVLNSASRDVAKKTGVYLIKEYTDVVLTGGVCLNGYAIINGSPFKVVTASYLAPFSTKKGITTVKAHIDNPNILITATDRADFKALVTSIKKL